MQRANDAGETASERHSFKRNRELLGSRCSHPDGWVMEQSCVNVLLPPDPTA